MPLKQKTLFGTTAKSQTYYKKKAETTFEKFIEAKWYFNNGGKRDQFYKAATKEWNEIKKDENAVSAINEKHSNAIKGEKKKIYPNLNLLRESWFHPWFSVPP